MTKPAGKLKVYLRLRVERLAWLAQLCAHLTLYLFLCILLIGIINSALNIEATCHYCMSIPLTLFQLLWPLLNVAAILFGWIALSVVNDSERSSHVRAMAWYGIRISTWELGGFAAFLVWA